MLNFLKNKNVSGLMTLLQCGKNPYKVLRHNKDIKVIEARARVIARASCI